MTNQLVLSRSKHALTQGELARLIDSSQTTIARIEAGESDRLERFPLSAAFGLQVVFGKRPENLFPDLYAEVEDAVMRQAMALSESLEGKNDRATEHKRSLLEDMVRRACSRPLTP